MNNVTLVGRLTHDPEIKELKDGTFRTIIDVAISRDYRNSDGIYDTDFIRCVLWNGIAHNTTEFCKKGDLVGVRGRIQVRSYDKNEETKYITEIIADKVSFLSSKKTDD